MSSPTLPSSTPAPSTPASGAPFDLLTWFELNRNRVLIGIGVVCAVVIALMVTRSRRQAEDRMAATSFFNLVPPTGPGDQPAPLDPQKLLKLTQEYSGTPSATQARLLAAGQLFAEGKYAEAQAQFTTLDESQADGPFQGIALLGVATSLDAQNKSSEAVAAYDRVISLFPNTGPAQQARISKARLIQGTQPAQALAALDDVLKNEYAFGYQEIAGAARARLLAQHPELDTPLVSTNQTRVTIPTNSPAAPAAAK
ncbi:MAG: tetratricopeptide repeat protein [Verrucomicrobiales bacterium]|nr:tetratricopeptide repeat protein [Verrucomicrobiales bacterium]